MIYVRIKCLYDRIFRFEPGLFLFILLILVQSPLAATLENYIKRYVQWHIVIISMFCARFFFFI